MLPSSPRVRAADDYPEIRARMEELRRERDQAADKYSAPVAGPRPHAVTAQRTPVNKPALSPALRRFIRSA